MRNYCTFPRRLLPKKRRFEELKGEGNAYRFGADVAFAFWPD
jgi:hypothetical protein